MGHWGVKSYEHDEAADALDAGFDRVHGAQYEELMDDRNPLSFEQVQQKLADSRTLEASIDALRETLGIGRSIGDAGTSWRDWPWSGSWCDMPSWVCRFPDQWRLQAIDWLENEEIDWEEETFRRATASQGDRAAQATKTNCRVRVQPSRSDRSRRDDETRARARSHMMAVMSRKISCAT